MLPKDFPCHKTVMHYYRWLANGTLENIHKELVEKYRALMEKSNELSVGIIDSQSVKNAQCTEARGYDAGKKIKGIKRHIVTDINGLALSINGKRLGKVVLSKSINLV